MTRKYQHINLPERFISTPKTYTPHKGRVFDKPPVVNYRTWGRTINRKLGTLTRYAAQKHETVFMDEDKGKNEVVLKFRGYPNKKFIEKYKIDILERRNEKTIIGRISNLRLPNQNNSDFEQLLADATTYKRTNRLRSYFSTIEDIKPVKLDEVIDIELKRHFRAHPTEQTLVDVSFSEGGDLTNRKLDKITEQFGDRLLSSLNSAFVHFCRVKLNYAELQELSLSFAGIANVDFAPEFELEPSGTIERTDGLTVDSSQNTGIPVVVMDTAINPNHILLNNAVVAHDGGQPGEHGTGVASLVICGLGIRTHGIVTQRNSIIAINMEPFMSPTQGAGGVERKIRDVVEQLSAQYSFVLVNLSANATSRSIYKRKPVHALTKLIDELCWKHNCLFVLSVGNLTKGTDEARLHALIRRGYPTYFDSEYAKVLPPGDSMNAISVGSIVSAVSTQSVAALEHPSPITRGNINGNFFLKPDLVHHDSNQVLNAGNLSSEDNGPYMASSRDNTTLRRDAGTSFAAPLVTHAAGVLCGEYPNYKNNTIKALLIHSADDNLSHEITNLNLRKSLIGNGLPNLEKALHSLATSSTIVVQDSIAINHQKNVRIPIPASIAGSSRKRLRVKMTLVYNPPVNTVDLNNYNPIDISARLLREDGVPVSRYNTRDKASSAFSKSNVKSYVEEFSTREHTDCFWEIEVKSETLIDEFHKTLHLDADYEQDYSVVLSIEDMNADDNIDLHRDISQMIEIDIPIEIEVNA